MAFEIFEEPEKIPVLHAKQPIKMIGSIIDLLASIGVNTVSQTFWVNHSKSVFLFLFFFLPCEVKDTKRRRGKSKDWGIVL